MRYRARLLFPVVAAACCLLSWVDAQAEMRTWTSQAGKTVQAEYIKTDGGVVFLEGNGGRDLRIPFASLNAESQAAVKALEKTAGPAAGAAAQPTGNELVDRYTREMGTVLGTYDHRLFQANFYENRAQMDLFLKEENGVVRSPPLRTWLHVYYKGSSDWLQRRMVKLEEPAVYDHGKIHYKLLMADDVHAEVYYEVAGNQIKMGYYVQDPPGIQYASQHMLRTQVTALFEFDNETDRFQSSRFAQGMTWEELKPKVSDYELILKPVKGKTEHYSYAETVGRFVSPLKRWEISGGAYGPRVIHARPPKSKGSLNAFVYSGHPPGEGYMLNYVNGDASDKSALQTRLAVITIE